MNKKLTIEESKLLLDQFNNIVKPWCQENKYSLHKAFDISRDSDPEKYNILAKLWSTQLGKEYLRSVFRSNNHFR